MEIELIEENKPDFETTNNGLVKDIAKSKRIESKELNIKFTDFWLINQEINPIFRDYYLYYKVINFYD
jgi:hypothetical protein